MRLYWFPTDWTLIIRGTGVFLENAEKLLERIDPDIPLGIYECPSPYKRLLTDRILEWMKHTGRFAFIKDTCCDPRLLRQRLVLLEDSGIRLFNANGQTFLPGLQLGGAGYSGIMANFHPGLYVRLFLKFEKCLKRPNISRIF